MTELACSRGEHIRKPVYKRGKKARKRLAMDSTHNAQSPNQELCTHAQGYSQT